MNAPPEWAVAPIVLPGSAAGRQRRAAAADPPAVAPPATDPGTAACVCCGTVLRLPPQSPMFRCTVCRTVNDLAPHDATLAQGQPTGVRNLQFHVDNLCAGVCTPQQFADAAIWPVFGSARALGLSFWDGPGGPAGGAGGAADAPSVPSSVRVDPAPPALAASIRPAVALLERALCVEAAPRPGSSVIRRALLDALSRALERPGFPLQRPVDILFLLFILELPAAAFSQLGAAEVAQQQTLVAKVCGFLGHLTPHLQAFVVNVMADEYTDTKLQSLVDRTLFLLNQQLALCGSTVDDRALQSAGGATIAPSAYAGRWEVRCAARLLALLHAANDQRPDPSFLGLCVRAREQVLFPSRTAAETAAAVAELVGGADRRAARLPAHVFYSTLVDYVDLVRDFGQWLQRQHAVFCFCQYPFIVSLGGKMRILDSEVAVEQTVRERDAVLRTLFQGNFTDPQLSISVRRSNLISDSVRALSRENLDFGKKLRISFVDEEGVDAGGLTKEWFLLLTRELFDPAYAIFEVDAETQQCWFSRNVIDGDAEFAQNFYLLGLIVALAIYNGNTLDIPLPLAAYKMLVGQRPSLEDLALFNVGRGQQLVEMLEFCGSAREFAETYFGIDFTVQYDRFGERVSWPLVPGGDQVAVTLENRVEYVNRYVDWFFYASCRTQFEAFRRGFYRVLTGKAAALFRPEELELLVRGSTSIDLAGLPSIAQIEGCDPADPLVQWLWEIVAEMDDATKRKFLSFVTGTDRTPATGVESMQFKVSLIRQGDEDRTTGSARSMHSPYFPDAVVTAVPPRGSSAASLTASSAASLSTEQLAEPVYSEHLPVAHTCFNQLCLYRYRSKQQLYEKLLQAIEYSEGFGLR